MAKSHEALKRAAMEDLAKRLAIACRHAVAGIPTPEDMAGLYRRVAQNHGFATADITAWWEAEKDTHINPEKSA